MPAAIAIPLISAAAGFGGAAIQSRAAKKAAETQSQSADRAMAMQSDIMRQLTGMGGGSPGLAPRAPRDPADFGYLYEQQPTAPSSGGGGDGGLLGNIWAQQQRMYQPYVDTGPATLSALHAFVGIPGAAQGQSAVPYGNYGMPMNRPGMPGMMTRVSPAFGGQGMPMSARPPAPLPTGTQTLGDLYRGRMLPQG